MQSGPGCQHSVKLEHSASVLQVAQVLVHLVVVDVGFREHLGDVVMVHAIVVRALKALLVGLLLLHL